MSEKKEAYQRPTIVKNTQGLVNKFGRLSSATPHTNIDGFSVSDLVQEYGSPLWVVSEATLRRRYKEMYRAFSLRYPKVAIAYSYKTNYLSGICSIFHQEGAWAEVVSGFEYEIALELGMPGNQIVFNGPYKTRAQLERAAKNGSMINIDSYDELYLLEEIALERSEPIEVGVRINMDLYYTYPSWNRFGFNLESGQAFDACKRVISSEGLRLVGLHIHVGTFILDPNVYRLMAEKLISLCYRLQDEQSVSLKYLDIGGGYASKNTLHSQMASGEHVNPTADQFAEAICPSLLKGPFKTQNMPLLILEPGRALVDEGMYLLTSVVATKTFPLGNKGVVLDAGINLLPTSQWYRHDILVARESTGLSDGGVMEEVTLYGPLCMAIDILRTSISLPPLSKEDVLVVKNVGGYNFSQSMQFIQPRPAVVLVSEKGVEYIRLPETTEYIRQLERVPERLAMKHT